MKTIHTVCVLGAVALLAGCNANGVTKVPGATQVSLGSIGKLQMAVGTVNIGTDGNKTGLNVVTTFRQGGGASAVLLDTPAITGPSGFVNGGASASPYVQPSGSTSYTNCETGILTAGADSGTASIGSDVQAATNLSSSFHPQHSFGTAGLLGAYGIQPFNETQGSTAYYPGNANHADCPGGHAGWGAYPQPFYISQGAVTTLTGMGLGSAPTYIGGPPAYPFFNDGTAPGGFAGYVSGFSAFEVSPVAGTYTLNVAVPASNASSASFSATASLTSTTPLPNIPAPTWTSDGNGGGTVSLAVPADSRIVETMIYIQANGLYFAVGPLKGTGTLTGTLPDTLGQCSTPGCQNARSIPAANKVWVYAATYDYPEYEASPGSVGGQGLVQLPTITGAGGQADVSLSPVTLGTE